MSCDNINTLNAELNPIYHLLALIGAHHILHVSRIRVRSIATIHTGRLYKNKNNQARQASLVYTINPLNADLNPIYHLLALLGVHHIFHVSGLRVKYYTLLLASITQDAETLHSHAS